MSKETVQIQWVHIHANVKQDTGQEQTVRLVSVSDLDIFLYSKGLVNKNNPPFERPLLPRYQGNNIGKYII